MKQAYDARGYRDFTPIPDLRVNEKSGTIDAIIDISEGNVTN